MARLSAEPLGLDALVAEARGDGDGAVALFVGTVRDHNRGRRVLHLEYTSYAEMAEREMARLEAAALERFSVSRVVVAHRTGRLAIGDISVVVVVAAPHREAALEACAWVIEALKRTVPIWKKEHFEGGEVWIEGAGETPAGP